MPSSDPPPPPAPPSLREHALALLICATAAAAILFEALFLDRTTLAFGSQDPRVDIRPWARAPAGELEPVNLVTPDLDGFILPGMIRQRQLLRGDSGPFWDDGQLMGYPIAANMPFPLFSPVARIVDGLEPVSAIDWMLFLHLAIAAFLAYRLGRLFGLDPPAAALGAIGYATSGWMYTHWHSPPILYTMAYWPGQIAAIEWLRRGRRARAIVEGGFFTGLVLVAGFPQVGMVLSAASALVLLLDGHARSLRNLAAHAVALALGVGLAAPQLALSAAAYEVCLRAEPDVQAATARRGLPPGALFGALLPNFFGRPTDFSMPDPPAPTMEEWLPQRRFFPDALQNNLVENALYPGALVLLLLFGALRRDVDRRALALLATAGIVLAGTIAGPHLAPLWEGFERLAAANVKRALAVVGGLLPLTAAIVYQARCQRRTPVPAAGGALLILGLVAVPWWAKTWEDPQAAVFATDLGGQVLRQVVLLAAGLAVLRAAPSLPLLRWGGVLLLALDLTLLARGFNPFPPQTEPFPATAVTRDVAARPGRVVIFGTAPNLLPGTAATIHGIRSLFGMVPMVPTRTAELLDLIEGSRFDRRDPRVTEPFRRVESLHHPLLDLLNVDTVVHADPSLPSRSGLPELFARPEEGLGGLGRPTAGPRAFLATGARVVPDPEERLSLLAAPTFDLHETVLLERPPRRPIGERGAWSPPVASEHGVDRHRLTFAADRPGVAVLVEAFDPGWRVTVDGRDADVEIVDHALLGVHLDEGRHVVEFTYVPPRFAAAVVAAAAALLLLICIALVGARRASQRAKTTSLKATS